MYTNFYVIVPRNVELLILEGPLCRKAYLRNPVTVLRIDAGEIKSVPFELASKGIWIKAEFKDVNIFVATHNNDTQRELEEHRKKLLEYENSFGFDPARNNADLEQLRAILEN